MATKSAKSRTAESALIVIFGKNHAAAQQHLNALKAKVLGDADPQTALSQYDDTPDWAGVHDELMTLPFLSERRLVVIRDAGDFISQNRQRLEQYLEAPSATGVLILMVDSFPKTTRLFKQLDKLGGLIACEPPSARQLPEWLCRYAVDEHGVTLQRDAAALLVELSSDDVGVVCREIDKLAAYVSSTGSGGTAAIDVDAVQELIGQSRMVKVFAVLDAMLAGKTDIALEQLGQMLQQDRDAQYTVIGAFAWGVRRLFQGRALLEQGTPPGAITSKLRVWSGQQAFLDRVKKLDLNQIGRLMRSLSDLDIESKTGGISVQLGLEQWIVSFARAGRR